MYWNPIMLFIYYYESSLEWINTNTACVRARRCKLQKGCTWLAAASARDYQLLAQSPWFSPDTPASSTTNSGRHDIAEISLKVALNTNKIKSIKSIEWINIYACTLSLIVRMEQLILEKEIYINFRTCLLIPLNIIYFNNCMLKFHKCCVSVFFMLLKLNGKHVEVNTIFTGWFYWWL